MSDYLDLRDLADELTTLQQRHAAEDPTDVFDEDELDRMNALLELEGELGGDLIKAADHDATLVPDDEWEDYCRELAIDVGMIQDDSPIESYVDWERWANDVKVDYSEIEFDGTTYYRRS